MTSHDRMDELLLECLGHLMPHQWPGGDGFTQEDMLQGAETCVGVQAFVRPERTIRFSRPRSGSSATGG